MRNDDRDDWRFNGTDLSRGIPQHPSASSIQQLYPGAGGQNVYPGYSTMAPNGTNPLLGAIFGQQGRSGLGIGGDGRSGCLDCGSETGFVKKGRCKKCRKRLEAAKNA